jgi:hypothetical protein
MHKLRHCLTAIPKVVPEGKIAGHNHIRPAVRLGVVSYDTVGLLSSDGERFVSSSGVRHFTSLN